MKLCWLQLKKTFSRRDSIKKVDYYTKQCEKITYTKTHSRSVLGSMDIFMTLFWNEYYLSESENVNQVNFNKRINQLIVSSTFPSEMLKEEFEMEKGKYWISKGCFES